MLRRRDNAAVSKEFLLCFANGVFIRLLCRPARFVRGFQLGNICRTCLLYVRIRAVRLGDALILVIERLHLCICRSFRAHLPRGHLAEPPQPLETFLLGGGCGVCAFVCRIASMRQPELFPTLHAFICIGERSLLRHGVDDRALLRREMYVAICTADLANSQIAIGLFLRQCDVAIRRHVNSALCPNGKIDCRRARERDVRALHGRVGALCRTNAAIGANAYIRKRRCARICLDDLYVAALCGKVDRACRCGKLHLRYCIRIRCALHEIHALCSTRCQVVRVGDAVVPTAALDPARIRFQIDSIVTIRQIADGTVQDEISLCMHVHIALFVAREEVHTDRAVCRDVIGVVRIGRFSGVPL